MKNRYLASLIESLTNGERHLHGRPYTPNPRHNYERLAEYLLKKGLRVRSVKEYLKSLHKFEADINPETLQNFQNFIRCSEKSETRIRQNYFVFLALQNYLKATGKKDLLQYLPDKSEVKKPKTSIHDKSFPEEDLDRLLSVCSDNQLKMFMKLLYYSGLRVTESLLIQPSWFDFEKKKPAEIIIPNTITKSRTQQTVLLSAKICKELQSYIKDKGFKDNDYLFEFIEKKTKRKNYSLLDRERLLVILLYRKLCKKANLMKYAKSLSSHCFRHSYAQNLRQQGFDLPEIQRLMRHSNVSTTMCYISPQNEQLKQKFAEKFG